MTHLQLPQSLWALRAGQRLSGAPPCVGYQHLLTASQLKQFSSGLAEKLTRTGVFDYEENSNHHFAAVLELQAATKSAPDELYGARVHQMTELNNRKKVDLREPQKRIKRMNPGAAKDVPKQAAETKNERSIFDRKPNESSRLKAVPMDEFKEMTWSARRRHASSQA